MPFPRPPDRRIVHIHYLRPPDRIERFVQRLMYDDNRVKVTFAREIFLPRSLRIRERVALEPGSDAVWFTFPGAWHDIGRFHRADGTLTGIYANILTPCIFEPGDDWHTTDLFLDLWLPAEDGRWHPGSRGRPVLLDEPELQRAEAEGSLPAAMARRAREEADRLMREAERSRWPPPIVGEWTRERIRSLPDR